MTVNQIQETEVLDARGLSCPMPIIKMAKAVRSLAPGQVLKLVTTDPGSIADVPAWCQSTSNELLERREEDDAFVFLVRKSEEV
jgi:TusA-related sulfurtransferase